MKINIYSKLLFVLTLSTLVITSCSKKEGCTNPEATNYDPDAKKDNGSCFIPGEHSEHGHLTFSFSHHFDGTAVTANDFNQLNYVNANNDTLSISKLRYLISDVRLLKTNGDTVALEGYQLVDLANGTGLTFAPAGELDLEEYTAIIFNFGFDAEDNVDNAYADLNSASWNVPSMLGGGYHYMQLEGKFIDNNHDTTNYAYHTIRAADNSVTPLLLQETYITTTLGGINLTGDATIEIEMNIAEWFKNPNTWDLDSLNTMLMPNFNAQIMMSENGQNVFSLGDITM